MNDLRAKLLAAFDVEHREHLARVRSILAEMNQASPGSNPAKLIGEAFLCAHSLKGASRIVDLKSVMELAHRLETLFAQIQKSRIGVTPELIDFIGKVLDRIEDIVVSSRSQGQAPAIDDLTTSLDAVLAGQEMPRLQKTGSDSQAVMPSEPLPPKKEEPAPHIALVKSTPAPSPAFDTMRLKVEYFDKLIKTAEEVISFSRNREKASTQFKDVIDFVTAMAKESQAMQKHLEKKGTSDNSRLAKYLHFVQEQIRMLGHQLRGLSADQKNHDFTLRLLGTRLQKEAQSARLMAANGVFDSFSKMMRDLAKDSDKDLNFKMSGMEQEADRMVLQALKDPLMHILRNALSHGIESPAVRERMGKPRSGTIAMGIEINGQKLSIVVNDDGQGIDTDRIKAKATELGLIAKDSGIDIPAKELQQFIFHPGFSTAEKITEISGRGVGLSVVKETIEKLQGTIDIESIQGQGCRFRLTLPVALSAHRLLLVRCHNQTLAIPTHSVQSVKRLKQEQIEYLEGHPIFRDNAKVIPVVTLSHVLGMKNDAVQPNKQALSFAILKMGERRLGLAVDAIVGEREGLIKELGYPLRRSERYSGGFLLDQTSVALVLNPTALFESFGRHTRVASLKIEEAKPANRKQRILIVDDSFTTRILEKSILEAKGFSVELAMDGTEALAFLNSNQVDLIISDVEMPRMDGLTLLKELKSNKNLAQIPTIIVSSRDHAEDRQKGLDLGADAYLSKMEFSQ